MMVEVPLIAHDWRTDRVVLARDSGEIVYTFTLKGKCFEGERFA